MVRGNQQASGHEVWEKWQEHEDARKVCRTKIFVSFFLGNGKSDIWDVMIWSEEWTDREKI